MIGGINGKILHVNLTNASSWVETPPEEFYLKLGGGRALAAYYLLREMPAGADPLGPDNLLIFAPGILQGSNFPGAGRHGVAGKSPLSGGIGSSESGGWWGHEFKRSGFDALIVHGKSEKPVYIWVKDGEVEIKPAGHLWGLKTGPVQAKIREELSDEKVRVAQIGPGGENLVRYAAIMHDVNRAAGRNGLGAVMGSKNLKAVAVRGTKNLKIADKERFGNVVKWFGKNYKTKAAWATSPTGRGTQDAIVSMEHMGNLPIKNFGAPTFPEVKNLSGERNYEMYLKERDTCQACPIACKSTFENEDQDPSRNLDPVYGGPEYEAMGSFGSSCGVSDNLAVLKANELANAYGLDSISAGMSIAFVMECFENGIITREDTGGLDYHWGDGEILVRSVKMIALRQGFGDVLAEGTNRMAKKFGPKSEPYNITVKGQELPMHEPRLKPALGVGYALAPVGADHMMNMHDTDYVRAGGSIQRVNTVLDENEKVGPVPSQTVNEDKMKIFYNEVNFRHFLDTALTCHFHFYDYIHLAEAMSGVTGFDFCIKDMITIGARANTLTRLFNLREGLSAADDRLPRRVMTPFEEGPNAGNAISEKDFEWAKHRFYEMMKWDPQTGEPTQECLQELGLKEFLDQTE